MTVDTWEIASFLRHATLSDHHRGTQDCDGADIFPPAESPHPHQSLAALR